MIEENDAKIQPAEHAAPEHYGEALIYDLAKFLTTLGILALGAVLTLSENIDLADIKIGNIVMVTIALGLAASTGALTAASIALSRYKGEAIPRYLDRFVFAGIALLGMGVGMFVYLWIDKLS